MLNPIEDNFLSRVKELCPDYFDNTEVLQVNFSFSNENVETFFNNPKIHEIKEFKQDSDIENLDLYYDIVVATGYLPSNLDWRKAFANIFESIKKGGCMVVMTRTDGSHVLDEDTFKPFIKELDFGSWHIERNIPNNDLMFFGVRAID
jgi:hypothetical protein